MKSRLFLKIYNEALQSTWGFVPLTDAECQSLGASLKLLVDPAVTSFIEIDGKAVGVGMGLPDYNPLIKKITANCFRLDFSPCCLTQKNQESSRDQYECHPRVQRGGLD